MSIWQEAQNRQEWNNFVSQTPGGSFLQSYEFGDFYSSLGKKVWRLACFDKELSSVCLLVKQVTKFGNFLYCPGGPLLTDEEKIEELITKVTQIAKEENANFVRFEPRIMSENQKEKLLSLGLRRTKNFTQPECTQILDLIQSFEVLRTNLSESTRHNIGWVERKGVRVVVSEEQEKLEIFEKLLSETSARQKFQLHRETNYYTKQFESFVKQGMAKLYLAYEPAEEGNQVLAAAVVINFGKTTTYLHSASSAKNPKLRAPYLMQWKIIEDAKNSGYEKYDFWGVAATDKPSDPWSGVTIFKKSFGGEKVCYEPPYDLILNKRYYIDILLEKARLILRKWR